MDARITADLVVEALESLLKATKYEMLIGHTRKGGETRRTKEVPDGSARAKGIELTAKLWQLWGDPRFMIPETGNEESQLMGYAVVKLTTRKAKEGWTEDQIRDWFATQAGQHELMNCREEALESAQK